MIRQTRIAVLIISATLGAGLFSFSLGTKAITSIPLNNGNYTVDVIVIPVKEKIAGVQISLSFNPSVYQITYVEQGELFADEGYMSVHNEGEIDNKEGKILDIWRTSIYKDSGSTKSGVLCHIHVIGSIKPNEDSFKVINLMAGNVDAIATEVTIGFIINENQ